MRIPAKSFRDLIVWQKAHALVLGLYRYTQDFPTSEKFGLTSQIRRAAVSVAANIAEGFPKPSNAEKLRFFAIAQGSLEEVHYYLILSHDLGYGDTSEFQNAYEEVARLLKSFTRTLAIKPAGLQRP